MSSPPPARAFLCPEASITNPITYRTGLEIAYHEAIIRQAYKDSVGVWTWSVGLTNATGHNVERYKDNPQTMEQCLAIYVWALNNYAESVRKAFAGTPLTEAQFAAALSFHWNTGSIAKASWVGMFKAGRMADAERSFKTRNKAGGKVVQGLTTRRAQEADLLFRGKWANDGTILEYTRLTANYTPVWSNGKRVHIETPLRAALGDREAATHGAEPTPAPPNPGSDGQSPPLEPAPQARTRADVMAELRSLLTELETLEN